MVSQDKSGAVNGCARLLPTLRPYLLGDVFPSLMNGLPIPCSPEIWELSRFAAVDFNAPRTLALAQFSSPLAVDLLEAALECASAQRAKKLITVSPLGVERLLRKAGFQAQRVGAPVLIDGNHLFGCWISCQADSNLTRGRMPMLPSALPDLGLQHAPAF